MALHTISTQPYPGQRSGASGLRKKVKTFMQPLYLDNFVQSLFDVLKDTEQGLQGKTLVLGGDGRFYNREAVQIILKLAAANGVATLVLGQGGLLSTPAASALIRKRQAGGGLILTASHHPGGPNADFGVQYNTSDGAPASESLMDAVYRQSMIIRQLHTSDLRDVDINRLGVQQVEQMRLEVIDPVADYLELMREQFDFDAIRALFKRNFRILVDCMHGVGGPYARAILEGELGAEPGSVMNADPKTDFGGRSPDPDPQHAIDLVAELTVRQQHDFGAALDGDADRHMILGRGVLISPSDSLAILTANARLIPAYRSGLVGVARSLPVSRAVDRVALALEIPCIETPGGWKNFGNLLESGRVSLCGDEHYGAGGQHAREKDGLWAVLFWLNVVAVTKRSVDALLRQHWRIYGRTFSVRHDYFNVSQEAADQMMNGLRFFGTRLVGKSFGSRTLRLADEFSYTDPVDGARSGPQGMRFVFNDGARVVFRVVHSLAQAVTMHIYMERHERDPERFSRPVALVLAELVGWANAISGVHQRTGRKAPHYIA